MYWIVAIVLLIVIGFILDREIYFYEGAHLGPRFQSWFYDQWASRYDAGKGDSQLHDDEMLAQPLLEKLQHVRQPFVLDFATGTGRLSYALLNQPGFSGHIIAVDLSQKMLEQAASKMDGQGERVEFLRQQSMPLPFADETFDAVCCLEVLELLPDAQSALNEMSRLLRPGGILLTSRGTEESGRKAKVKSEAEFTSMLEKNGFGNIEITKWWKLFDRAFASKGGSSDPVGRRSLADILLCSSCGGAKWTQTINMWKCGTCGKELTISHHGIVFD